MNWSRAKTVLIVLLLAVNAFLLVTYITRENSVRRDEVQVRADVCRILGGQGISVSEDVIPLDSVRIRPAILIEKVDMKRAAERVFGETKETRSEGSTTYLGKGGSILLSGDMFSLVCESEEIVGNEEDALRLASDIASKLYIKTERRYFSCNSEDGGYVVSVPCMLSGVEVFNCGIDIKISESGSVIASGKFIGKGSLRRATGNAMNTSAVMLEFADGIREAGYTGVKISRVNLGYMSKGSVSGRVVLTPVLEAETSVGVFHVDMQTGAFLKI